MKRTLRNFENNLVKEIIKFLNERMSETSGNIRS